MVIEPMTDNGLVILTNGGGFLDFLSQKKGGYNLAKVIARRALNIDGLWSVSE